MSSPAHIAPKLILVASRVELFRQLGHPLSPGARVLDFGCGGGDVVMKYRQAGFDAHGCDLELDPGPHRGELEGLGLLRAIESDPYRIPFPDDFFDAVVSNEVFEHVLDYDQANREIARILKPGGFGYHVFPSWLRPLEPHLDIPLATLFRPRWWIYSWTWLQQRFKGPEESRTADLTRSRLRFLREGTNYLSRRQIVKALDPHFSQIRFCEFLALKTSPRPDLYRKLRWIPGGERLVSAFYTRALFCLN